MAEVQMPDHTRVQLPRERTAIVNGYIGPEGELIMDKTRVELRLHDGVKKGGHRFLSSTALATLFLGIDSEAGKLKFSGGQFGFLTRISNDFYKIRTLTSEDGIRIVNSKGIDANPIIGLPSRLAEVAGNYAATNEVADCDLISVTGFYGLKANAVNIPTDLQETAASTLIVIQLSSVECTQMIHSVNQEMNVWVRSKVGGSWQPWVVLKPEAGTGELLEEGKDSVQRTWTARQLAEFITDRLKDISSEDDSGTVLAYGGSQKKFKDAFDGPGIGDKTYGPYGSGPTSKERWIVYTTTKPKVIRTGGSSGENRYYGGGITIQVEVAGKWEVAFQMDNPDGTPGATVGDVFNSDLRFMYDGTSGSEKILVCNGDWVTTNTINGEWSGKIKFSTSQQTMSMKFVGYRFKLKT